MGYSISLTEDRKPGTSFHIVFGGGYIFRGTDVNAYLKEEQTPPQLLTKGSQEEIRAAMLFFKSIP